MPFRKVTLKEWEALGLPTEISNIHLGNPDLVKKMKEHSEKKKRGSGQTNPNKRCKAFLIF